MSDDKCTCGATKVPGTGWCFTCNPEYKHIPALLASVTANDGE